MMAVFLQTKTWKLQSYVLALIFCWIFLLVGPWWIHAHLCPLLPLTFQPWVLFLSAHLAKDAPAVPRPWEKTIKNNSQLPEKRTGWNPKKIWRVFRYRYGLLFFLFPKGPEFQVPSRWGCGGGCVCVVTSTVAGWTDDIIFFVVPSEWSFLLRRKTFLYHKRFADFWKFLAPANPR